MIVKNESAVIARCLRSFLPHVTCAVILDTGSSDNTSRIILEETFDHSVPLFRPAGITFQDFSQARNAVLKATSISHLDFDYLLHVDADMTCSGTLPDSLEECVYNLVLHHDNLRYAQPRLLSRRILDRVKYIGSTHEYLDLDGIRSVPLPSFHLIEHADGGNRADKIERDILLLEDEIAADSNNSRATFYLANSYFDDRRYFSAIETYTKRIGMGGWIEEVFYSKYRKALVGSIAAASTTLSFITDCLACWNDHPHRVEPLYALAAFYMRSGQHRLGYEFATLGLTVPYPPPDCLFVEQDVYDWRLDDVRAVCAFYLPGRREIARITSEKLLQRTDIPPADRERIRKNLEFCLA